MIKSLSRIVIIVYMRKNIKLIEGEYYHIYNRGVDKRTIFKDKEDVFRFLKTITEFNQVEPIGGMYVSSFKKNSNCRGSTSKLVRFVVYCVNQNHFHFLISPLVEKGIEKFMHKLSTGYTMYFNEKYDRSGALFQGRYKKVFVETNEYLLHLSAYINMNYKVHKDLNDAWFQVLPISSIDQYIRQEFKNIFCDTSVILNQFSSKKEYEKYVKNSLLQIIKKKEIEHLPDKLLIE